MIGFRVSVPDLGEALRGVAGAAERYTETVEFANLVREATVTDPGSRGSIANQINVGGYFRDGALIPWKKAHKFGGNARGRFANSLRTGREYGATNRPMQRSGSGEPGGSLDSGHNETFRDFWIKGTAVAFRQGRGVIQPNTSSPTWERFKMYQQRPGTEMKAAINDQTHVGLQKVYRYVARGGTAGQIGGLAIYPETTFTWDSRPLMVNAWMAEAVARIYRRKVDQLISEAFSRRQSQAAGQNRVAAGVSEGGRFDVGFK